MKSIICLSGWGQQYSSLEDSFCSKIKQNFKIESLNYLNFRSAQDFFQSTYSCQNPDVIVGWSLGGQLALRLIAKKIFTPKLLILIAPPFQLVKDSRIQSGMTEKIFNEFYFNLKTAPNATLKKFAILSIMNDKNKSDIIKNLKIDDSRESYLVEWLEELKNFSCFDIEIEDCPQAQYLIGLGDSIVHPSQAKYFKDKFSNIHINYFSNCGHAPHLSDNKLYNQIILSSLDEAFNFNQ